MPMKKVKRFMSHGFTYLHSHSALERELRMPKHLVLVDAKFASSFLADTIQPFRYRGVEYYKVPILSFVKMGGVFKNLLV